MIFSGLLLAATQIVREKIPIKSADKSLRDDFKIPQEVVAAFLPPLQARCTAAAALFHHLLCDRLAEIESTMSNNTAAFTRVQDLRWRVDVHISNAVLNKLLKPTVLMQMVMQVRPSFDLPHFMSAKLSGTGGYTLIWPLLGWECENFRGDTREVP